MSIVPSQDKISKLVDVNKIEKITAKLFGQRRKMVRGIISNIDWGKYGLTGTERAEELKPEIFARLAQDLV